MIAIIDITGNNLTSLTNAIKGLGYDYCLTHNEAEITKASKVILPGVGAALPAMKALRNTGLVSLLKSLDKPLLGICLGMQLLFEQSEEGQVECLGLIPGVIKRFLEIAGVTIPHIGWNQLTWQQKSPLQERINLSDYVYFVHSYLASPSPYTLATSHNGEPFSAIVQKDNVVGMQFHPEKSGQVGLELLNNFLKQEALC